MSDYDVVFLSHGDWANIGSHLAESLRRVGVKAKSWANWHMRMDMPIKSSIYEKFDEVVKDVRETQTVFLMHGYIFPGRELPLRRSQLICAFHGGPPLLQMNKNGGVNQDFFGRYSRRDLFPVHFIQMPKLFDLCYFLERVHLLSPPVDLARLTPRYYDGKRKAVLGHFPRNTGTGLITKGHEKVVKVFYRLRKRFPNQMVNTSFVDWTPHIDRVNKCDIYVEKLSTVCPEWGMSSLEAAALGKIVVTQFDNRKTYEKYYGPSPILSANTDEELEKVIRHLGTLDPNEIVDIQKRTRAWVEKYHSFEAVGSRLKNILIKEGAKIG